MYYHSGSRPTDQKFIATTNLFVDQWSIEETMSEVPGDDVVSSYDTGKIQPITSSYSIFKRTLACFGRVMSIPFTTWMILEHPQNISLATSVFFVYTRSSFRGSFDLTRWTIALVSCSHTHVRPKPYNLMIVSPDVMLISLVITVWEPEEEMYVNGTNHL